MSDWESWTAVLRSVSSRVCTLHPISSQQPSNAWILLEVNGCVGNVGWMASLRWSELSFPGPVRAKHWLAFSMLALRMRASMKTDTMICSPVECIKCTLKVTEECTCLSLVYAWICSQEGSRRMGMQKEEMNTNQISKCACQKKILSCFSSESDWTWRLKGKGMYHTASLNQPHERVEEGIMERCCRLLSPH